MTETPRVVHIVTTAGFAGVERYVCDVARASTARGWDVTVLGGEPERMGAALAGAAHWQAGATLGASLRSLRRLGRFDVCNAHMTAAETAAVLGRPLHRAPIVATRHFAAHRGASLAGRLGAPLIAVGVARNVALGEFIAHSLERRPDAVVLSGVRPSPRLWHAESRAVLMLQRLESEKDTLTGLQAWQLSGLAREGWTLTVFGEGSQREELDRWVTENDVAGITFKGWTSDVPAALGAAGMMLATATAEPLGLSVLDAMAAGVPVVASAAGGHLETIGRVERAPLFPPGDPHAAALALRGLLEERERRRLSELERSLVDEQFTIDRHVDGLLLEYETLLNSPGRRSPAAVAGRAT